MEIVIVAILGVLVAEVSFLIYMTTRRAPILSGRRVYVDTSALMDGRIVTAARTGFIPDRLVIPTSVVAELQLLADQADSERRARARRGLDAIVEMQELDGISVTILNDGPTGEGGVDARLVELTKKDSSGVLCTIDFNLNKVAVVNGITVLNINELAGNIRMAFLPGETISLALTQKGQGDAQAVGYLADGTMVVVDKAAKEVGKTVHVEFIRSLQTAAGRMMFAKLVSNKTTTKLRGPEDTKLQPASNPAVDGSSISTTEPSKRMNVAKANGRKPSVAKQQKSTQTNNDNVQNKQRVNKPKSAQSREDSLLELVNNQ